jgi:hypothetical protein
MTGAPGNSPDHNAARVEKRLRRSAASRWRAFEQIAHWPALVPAPFPSKGHEPTRLLGSPKVAPQDVARYRNAVLGTTVPTGFIVAIEHTDRSSGAPDSTYGMEKLGDGLWRYTVTDARGVVQAEGALARCERCHAEAPADHLYGLPNPSLLELP